jgi:chromosome segregation protein
LKKQVEKAERSLEVQAELKRDYAEYLKREDTYIAFHFDNLTAKRRVPVTELEALSEKITAAKEALQDNEDEAGKEALQAVEREYKIATTTRQQAQHELSQLQGQISFLERRLAHVQKSEKSTNRLIPQAHLEELVADIADKAEKALNHGTEDTLKRALSDLILQLRSFLHKSEGEVIDTTEADKEELEKVMKQVSAAEETVSAALEAEKTAEEQIVAIRTAKMTDLEGKRIAERDMFDLMQKRREREADITRIDNELSVLQRDRDDFKQELQEAVSLLGRGASDYFNFIVIDESEVEVSHERIVNESRDTQRVRRRSLEKLKIRLEELGVGATEDLLLEYNNAKERDEFLEKELADLETSVQNLRTLITELQGKLEEQFNVGVEKIATEFSKFFALMFGGGSASLKRVAIKNRQSDDEDDSEDVVTEEGIELDVSLPNKRVRGLDMLSGGERALTSIALIFAMSQVNPPPFIILDETDAALDEANSRRYGDMIEALAAKSQLVLITHNRETMSRAGILYGITMGIDGISKVLSVKFDEAAVNAK